MRGAPRAAAAALACVCVLGCGTDPEQSLLGRWEEVEWRYDKFDGYSAGGGKWIDGFRFPQYEQQDVVRHEAEYWEFQPGRILEISLRNGDVVRSRWRLKGRGHVLTLRHEGSDSVELYDVKELTEDELVLHYDIGMEVRGIARLRFRKSIRPDHGAPRTEAAPGSKTSNSADAASPGGGEAA